MSDSVNKIFDQLSELRLAEVILLVEKMKAEWNISLDAPATAVVASNASVAPVVEEKSEFNITIEGFAGENKISAIKEVRAITQLGLSEAKNAVEECGAAPKEILTGIAKDKANEIKTKLESVGLKVKLT